jgi:S1-C subfamily serine protease
MASPSFKPAISKFAIAHGLLKLIAIVCGLALSQICLMATVGLVTESGWIRVLAAFPINLLIPFALVDRALPKDDPTRAKGLASDLLALVWLGFPFLFIVAGHGVTSGPLAREAQRFEEVRMHRTATAINLLAGVSTGALTTVPSPPPPASGGSASSRPSASVPPPTSATASASTSTSARPRADAGPPPAPDAGRDKTPAELFKQLSPSVVTVRVSSGAGTEGGGTGFLIDDKGTIATNHHVIDAAKNIEIKFINGALFKSVDLLADDASRDLALLRVDLNKPEDGPKGDAVPLVLGDSEKVEVGERALSIGNPLGLEHTLTDGLVSARRMYEGKQWIQMSVPVSPGNSGGPLFNMRGEVIGVTTAQIMGGFGSRAQNLNLAVPINALKAMLQPDYPQRRKFGDPAGSSQW